MNRRLALAAALCAVGLFSAVALAFTVGRYPVPPAQVANVLWAKLVGAPSGLDPVMTAVVDQLTLDGTRKIGATAVVVSHDMTSVFRIATRMIMLGNSSRQGEVVAEGTPDEIRKNPDPFLQQFIRGEADGPIPLRMAQDEYLKHLLGDG
jgi:hypothetical protein